MLNRLLNKDFIFTVEEGTNISEGMKQFEAAYYEQVFVQARYNQSKAANLLSISRGTFRTKMKEYFGDSYIGGGE